MTLNLTYYEAATLRTCLLAEALSLAQIKPGQQNHTLCKSLERVAQALYDNMLDPDDIVEIIVDPKACSFDDAADVGFEKTYR